MQPPKLPMGCLSSRSTIAPSERVETATTTTRSKTKLPAKNGLNGDANHRPNDNGNSDNNMGRNLQGRANNIKGSQSKQNLVNSTTGDEDDIMSIIMNDNVGGEMKSSYKSDGNQIGQSRDDEGEDEGENAMDGEGDRSALVEKLLDPNDDPEKSGSQPTEKDLDLDMLRQYVAIDYEITQLENKDALRVYHEKIEQLEQLERELDMISSEAEEVATRSVTQLERLQSVSVVGGPHSDSKMDFENNSMLSGATGSMSHKSWQNGTPTKYNKNTSTTQIIDIGSAIDEKDRIKSQRTPSHQAIATRKRGTVSTTGSHATRNTHLNNMSYSTVEEVFDRKIILEKERDKLKKEVEMVIIECDRLQQRYKKRDDILDLLFDGRPGNGLENHLEHQLNWLDEQKKYVDQVFYAWKRAETLTSQTCEQFANALDLMKQLPKVEDPEQRAELIKSIGDLLIKSRRDMEQAQRYNPNVDAPFFTDHETERFDTIIESLSGNSMSQSEYSQVFTVIQFAYKRSVSIRLWLEQILRTTIARDSFELAEEFKWISVQLRKERINLIRSKLQTSPYKAVALSVQEQIAGQQQQQLMLAEKPQDSGIESETNEMDIEEEIYRLLELNRARIENNDMSRANSSAKQLESTNGINSAQTELKVMPNVNPSSASSSTDSSDSNNRDERMRDRIQKRVKGEQPLHLSNVANMNGSSNPQVAVNLERQTSAAGSGSLEVSIKTPTRLRVELDEEARQRLLKQVDQIHSKHRSKIEKLRGSNKAMAASSIMNRVQQVRDRGSVKNQETTGSETAPLMVGKSS